MSNDLEKFLQQAAQKLRDKVQQGQAPQAPQQQRPRPTPPPLRPVRQQERRAVVDEIIEAEVISDDRSAGSNPLSNLDTRRPLAQEIDQADERMAGHVRDAFAHEVSHFATSSSSPNQTTDAVEVNMREQVSSPFLRMLRQPDTLRAAFIASEVFQRKF